MAFWAEIRKEVFARQSLEYPGTDSPTSILPRPDTLGQGYHFCIYLRNHDIVSLLIQEHNLLPFFEQNHLTL